MPQLQILNRQPGFGEELGAALGGGLSQGISGALTNMLETKKNKQQLEGMAPFFEELGVPKETVSQMISSGVNPKDAMAFADLFSKRNIAREKEFGKQQLATQKQQVEQQEKAKEEQGIKNALGELRSRTPYVGTTVIPGFKSFTAGGLNREAVQQREMVDKLGFWATDKVYTHFNKGVVSNPKFKEIKENLAPHSGLSEREYIARIDALEAIMNLPPDISPKEFDKIADQEIKKAKKIENRPPLEAILG